MIDDGGVGIRALAVECPRGVRTNEYWKNHHPDILAAVNAKVGAYEVWAGSTRHDPESSDFDAEMAPYLTDPFRGTVERRVLTPGESAITLELAVAKKVLAAANMATSDIDLMLVSSFLPDTLGAMDAAYLAQHLGLQGAAWNLESACAGAYQAIQTACGLVRAGDVHNVLVIVSCTYSRDSDTRDAVSWTVGDGAGAFVIGKVEAGHGRLGAFSVHTGVTCGALWYENVARSDGTYGPRIRANNEAGKVLRQTAKGFLQQCSDQALKNAHVNLDEIDHFVVNTPLAWYAKFCARVLQVDPSRFVDTYPKYANVGPALLPLNLHHAVRERAFKKGDLVLLYSIGSVSSAGAMVVRWGGDVAIGPPPAPPELLCD